MRDYKFRAQHYRTKEWIYGSFIQMDSEADQCFIYPWYENASSFTCEYLVSSEMIPIIPETVGQYTGLHDKNGKEIYEGDIVSCRIRSREHIERDYLENKAYSYSEGRGVWSIEYKERFSRGNGFYFYGKNRRFNIRATQGVITNCDCEVIGNIYENPELLKGGENE